MGSRFLYPEKLKVRSYGFSTLAEAHILSIRVENKLNHLNKDVKTVQVTWTYM